MINKIKYSGLPNTRTYSLCTEPGSYCKNFVRIPEKLLITGEEPKLNKSEQILFSECYSDKDTYTRQESEFKYIDSIVLDIDNSITPEEFNRKYGKLNYYIYHTHSSTQEHTKCRIIIPLDRNLCLEGLIKEYKLFKVAEFGCCDIACQLWYYVPDLGSVMSNRGTEYFSSSYLSERLVDISNESYEKKKRSKEKLIYTVYDKTEDKNPSLRYGYYKRISDIIRDSKTGDRDLTIFKSVSSLINKFGSYSEEWIPFIEDRLSSDIDKLKMFRNKIKRLS